MKYCSRNHQNPDDAIFCNECGEKLLNKATSNKCPKCGSSNPKEAVFCHNCGYKLEEKEKTVMTKEIECSPSTTKQTSTQYRTTSSSTDEPIPLGCGIAMILVGGILLLNCFEIGAWLIVPGVIFSIKAIYRWFKEL